MKRYMTIVVILCTLAACQSRPATQDEMDKLDAAREWQDKVRSEEIHHPRCDIRPSGTGTCVTR
ncbi:MAG: hypothetical protein NZ828_01115 [Alphaproteobacteria bacterium]|nr:hypothetical protein [Alphaproteobacteria bacterium]MCS5595833.1 hypothetical protein [Alphaproteobacteria bacterium]|tara:strand:+ start:12146 stop:12337 length:192 start_codon:yes stop_codon:yes gene_type:complete